MAQTMDFEVAFDRLIDHEGGYVDDPNDPGGETKWGISKRSYPHLVIKDLSRDDAKAIYRRDFWQRISADKLPGSVAFQLFDFAVNSGIETAVRHFQRAIGVADDGHWGPHSQAAAEATSETDAIMLLLAERIEFMTRRKNWPDHGKGWARRIANNLRYGAKDS
jgi:lysozyme family protein